MLELCPSCTVEREGIDVIIRLGPLPYEGALSWTEDTLSLLDALGDSPLLPFALPREQVEQMRSVLVAMHRRALSSPIFTWEVEVSVEELKPMLTYWLNIGRLSDETVTASGGRWATAAGEDFHGAILTSLLDQLEEVDPTYVSRLRLAWRLPVKGAS